MTVLAETVLTVATHICPAVPSQVVRDGSHFFVLKGGKNISGRLTAEEAATFIAEQVRDALFHADASGVFPGSVALC